MDPGMMPDPAPSTPIHMLPPLGRLPLGPPAPRIKSTAAPGTRITHLLRR